MVLCTAGSVGNPSILHRCDPPIGPKLFICYVGYLDPYGRGLSEGRGDTIWSLFIP